MAARRMPWGQIHGTVVRRRAETGQRAAGVSTYSHGEEKWLQEQMEGVGQAPW